MRFIICFFSSLLLRRREFQEPPIGAVLMARSIMPGNGHHEKISPHENSTLAPIYWTTK